jgi:ethanolamine-phosphate cytidylyltransferase
MILYLDMVADLLHYGHIAFIKKMYTDYNQPGDQIYIGVHNDAAVASYKRTPILTMEERIKVLEGCKYIDKIIPDAPLTVTDEYVKLHGIDKIFIPNNRTSSENELMLSAMTNQSNVEIITIAYTSEISTTAIIQRCKNHV